jgi:hypothetical protein
LACGLLLLPLTFRRRRKALLLVALLAILAGGISSCTSSGVGLGGSGGSGGSGNGAGLTPTGNYTIPVNVTMYAGSTSSTNFVTHPVTAPTGPLTLTVD